MVILTARLALEPLRVGHAAEMAVVLGDPELYRFTGGRPATVEELRERYARWVAGPGPGGDERWRNWIARRRDDAVPLGWLQATVTGAGGERTAELAWTIGVAHQGNGYAREAAAAVMAALRGQDVVHWFVAHIDPDHTASIGIARALGLAATDQVDEGEVVWRTPG